MSWRLAGVFLVLLALGRPAAAEAPCREQALPVTVRGTRPLVLVELDGKPARMVLDTGTSLPMLLAAAPGRLGLAAASRGPERMMSHGRPFEVGFAAVSQVTFAGLAQPASDMAVVTGGWDEPGVDGFFNDARLQQADFDLGRAKARLLCAGAGPPDWAQAPGAAELRLEDRRRLFVTVLVNGVPLRAMLDSGSPDTSMTLEAARRAGVAVEGAPVAGEAGLGMATPLPAWPTRLPGLRLGAETLAAPRMLVVDKPNASADMLLGFDFFSTHEIWVDKSAGRVWIRKSAEGWLAR